MKYIKKFNEEFTFDIAPIEFTKSGDDEYVDYRFNCEGYDWLVSFSFNKEKNKWGRDYDIDEESSSIDGFKQVNKNPINIISGVTYITKMFIEEYSPDCISIYHLNMDKEKCRIGSMNKRSKINYSFLTKHINGYNLSYYSVLFGFDSFSNGTIALICKNGKEEEYQLNSKMHIRISI